MLLGPMLATETTGEEPMGSAKQPGPGRREGPPPERWEAAMRLPADQAAPVQAWGGSARCARARHPRARDRALVTGPCRAEEGQKGARKAKPVGMVCGHPPLVQLGR